MTQFISLSALSIQSRRPDAPVSFSGSRVHTWAEFAGNVSAIRAFIEKSPMRRWILNCDDIYLFACAFLAILQSGREAQLCANTTPSFIEEISGPDSGFLCGQDVPGSVRVQSLLPGAPAAGDASLPADFPLFSADDARVTLYTSGSTGKPKAFPKRLTELEAEASELRRLWGDLIGDRKIYSTVNHQHIYGLLFTVFVPLTCGVPFCADQIKYPESLETLGDPAPALVCSPAFFKRVAETEYQPGLFPGGAVIFSSGGKLDANVAREVEKRLGTSPMEIYGSTETGGIAFRKSVRESLWTPFPRNDVSIADDGRIVVKSPYILDPAGFISGDLGRFVDPGHFVLEGRVDSIVKIEEKRISLTEVENRLAESPYVKEACVIALAGKRQYLGAVIVLNRDGTAFFGGRDKKELNAYFHDHLARFLENTVIPKKWRFLDALPVNTQGKLLRGEIERLFRKQPDVEVRSVHHAGNRVDLMLAVRPGSVYFDGHFPEFRILPGVVQFDLVMKYGAEYLGIKPRIKSITRVKFRKPILPDAQLALGIEKTEDGGRISFKYADPASGEPYSEGTIDLEATP